MYVFHDLVFQDMNTSENYCQDLADQFPKSNTCLFKTWHAKFWNVTLICNSMFPSLDTDCIIQDLAFQVLNPFGVINFSIRPKKKILCFSWLGFPRHEHKKMIVKTWQTNFRNLSLFCSRLGMPSFEMLHCFATPCSQFLTMIALFKTWLSKSWNPLWYQMSNLDPYQIYVFHGLVFQIPKSNTFLFRSLDNDWTNSFWSKHV